MTWSPGDFIKPDPTLSNDDAREHILNELHRYFTDPKNTSERLVRIQNLVSGTSLENNSLGEVIFDILHAHLVETKSFLEDLLPADIAATFCEEVIGFVEEDTLPDGPTILSIWPDSDSDVEMDADADSAVKEISFWDMTVSVPVHVLLSGVVVALLSVIAVNVHYALALGTEPVRFEL
jgi:hypothetical protein